MGGMLLSLLVSAAWLAVTVRPLFAQDELWRTYIAAADQALQANRYESAELMLREALREAERFGSEDLRLAISQDLLEGFLQYRKRSVGQPLYRPRWVSERMNRPDGVPGRAGRSRGPRTTRCTT